MAMLTRGFVDFLTILGSLPKDLQARVSATGNVDYFAAGRKPGAGRKPILQHFEPTGCS
jgi:hypothetical protein